MDSITLNRFIIMCLIPQSWAVKMFPLFYFFLLQTSERAEMRPPEEKL